MEKTSEMKCIKFLLCKTIPSEGQSIFYVGLFFFRNYNDKGLHYERNAWCHFSPFCPGFPPLEGNRESICLSICLSVLEKTRKVFQKKRRKLGLIMEKNISQVKTIGVTNRQTNGCTGHKQKGGGYSKIERHKLNHTGRKEEGCLDCEKSQIHFHGVLSFRGCLTIWNRFEPQQRETVRGVRQRV